MRPLFGGLVVVIFAGRYLEYGINVFLAVGIAVVYEQRTFCYPAVGATALFLPVLDIVVMDDPAVAVAQRNKVHGNSSSTRGKI